MKNLNFDSGVKSFKINGSGVLRFNPSDPNVYARFLEAAQKISSMEGALVAKAKAVPESDGAALVRLMAETDRDVKKTLDEVFGGENDFDKILGGVNIMAVGDNGERVITNLLHALMPIIREGVEQCTQQKIDTAVTQVKLNRQQRKTQHILQD